MTRTTTEGNGRGRWPPALSLRLRLLGWALLLLAVASLASVVVIRQVLLNQLETRVTADLEQEVAEFRLLAGGQDPATGEPFGADLARIADTYLIRNEPQAGESVLILVGGEFYGASPNPPHDLSTDAALVDRWASAASSQWGEVGDTPAGPARWLAVPVAIDGAVRGHVVVSQFMAAPRAEIDRAVRVMALACLLVIMVVAAGGYLAMGRALRPLRAVTETARAIEETDLSRRIRVTGSDEVARLGRTFNAMVGRLERAFATQQAFLSDVGHELAAAGPGYGWPAAGSAACSTSTPPGRASASTTWPAARSPRPRSTAGLRGPVRAVVERRAGHLGPGQPGRQLRPECQRRLDHPGCGRDLRAGADPDVVRGWPPVTPPPSRLRWR